MTNYQGDDFDFSVVPQLHPTTISPELADFDFSIKSAYIRKTKTTSENMWGWELTNTSDILHIGDIIYIFPEDPTSISTCPFPMGLNVFTKFFSFKGPYAIISLESLERRSVIRAPLWAHTAHVYIPEDQRLLASMARHSFPNFHVDHA